MKVLFITCCIVTVLLYFYSEIQGIINMLIFSWIYNLCYTTIFDPVNVFCETRHVRWLMHVTQAAPSAIASSYFVDYYSIYIQRSGETLTTHVGRSRCMFSFHYFCGSTNSNTRIFCPFWCFSSFFRYVGMILYSLILVFLTTP